MACSHDQAQRIHSQVMMRLAHSEIMAINTLERTKAKMPASNKSKPIMHHGKFKHSNTTTEDDSEKYIKDNCEDVHKKRGTVQGHCTCTHTEKGNHETVFSQSVPNIDSSLCVDRTLKLVGYYMDRISFQCECHYESLPPCALSKADKLHCRRFHRGVLKRKNEKKSHEH